MVQDNAEGRDPWRLCTRRKLTRQSASSVFIAAARHARIIHVRGLWTLPTISGFNADGPLVQQTLGMFRARGPPTRARQLHIAPGSIAQLSERWITLLLRAGLAHGVAEGLEAAGTIAGNVHAAPNSPGGVDLRQAASEIADRLHQFLECFPRAPYGIRVTKSLLLRNLSGNLRVRSAHGLPIAEIPCFQFPDDYTVYELPPATTGVRPRLQSRLVGDLLHLVLELSAILVVAVDQHHNPPIFGKPSSVCAQTGVQVFQKITFALERMYLESHIFRKQFRQKGAEKRFHRAFLHQKL